MSFSFANLTPSEVAAVGNDLDTIQRLCAVWSRWCDFEGVEAHARLIHEETQRSLKAMADLTKAERSLEAAKTDKSLAAVTQEQERQAAELRAEAAALADRTRAVELREQKVAAAEESLRKLLARMQDTA